MRVYQADPVSELLVRFVHSDSYGSNYVSEDQFQAIASLTFLSWKLYIIFAALCFAIAIVCYLFYPVSAPEGPYPPPLLTGCAGNRPQIPRSARLHVHTGPECLRVHRPLRDQSGHLE